MDSGRLEYVIDDAGLDGASRVQLCLAALALVAPSAATAETDLPWTESTDWPSNVVSAAARLRDRFVPAAKHGDGYVQTRVQPITDEQTRADFVTFAPYALDASLWSASGEHLASLADEGTSCVVRLFDLERDALMHQVGTERVIALAAWRAAHPGVVRRLVARFQRH